MLKELSGLSAPPQLRKRSIDVANLISDVLESMKESFNEKRIHIRFASEDSMPKICADPERLNQVFMNIFLNAINAMPNGGYLSVSIGLKTNDVRGNIFNFIAIKIEDTGKGIPENFLGRIFSPYQTATKEGTGLGLTISRRIINVHGGHIQVESKLGVGTSFVVMLPLTHQHSLK